MGLFDIIFKKKINKLKTETANKIINSIRIRAPKNYIQSSGYSGGDKFQYGISTSGSGVCFDHSKVLVNSRRAVWDSVQAKTLVDRFADTVVDVGLKLEAMPKSNILKPLSEAYFKKFQ